MIDKDIIDGLPGDLPEHAKVALAAIHQTGIIDKQQRREFERIVNGNADQPIEEAVQDLLKSRRAIQSLQMLAALCRDCDKEVNNA